ncbi:hypothetical protein L6R50_19425 [Myxococcota bacterium]|nr:hypothetical protein [Myxococcota bacterium]
MQEPRRPVAARSPGRHRGSPPDRVAFGIDPFELFCAYHLGLAPDGARRSLNLHEVGRALRAPPGAVRQALADYGMDADTMMDLDFDVVDARVDVDLAPDGIDPVEVARMHYDGFLAARRAPRDWGRILADDARENEKVFGPGRPSGGPRGGSRGR